MLSVSCFCLCRLHVPRRLTSLHRWVPVVGKSRIVCVLLFRTYMCLYVYVLQVCFPKADVPFVGPRYCRTRSCLVQYWYFYFYGCCVNTRWIPDTAHVILHISCPCDVCAIGKKGFMFSNRPAGRRLRRVVIHATAL